MKFSKQKITVGLAAACLLLITSLQPFFLGYNYYFGLDARIICMPLAFLVLPFLFIHIYQNCPLLVSLYRRSINKDRKAKYYFGTTVAMMVIGFTDIVSGWVSGVSGNEKYIIFPMWVWSWSFTILIIIHSYQRRKILFNYLSSLRKARPIDKTEHHTIR